MKFKLEFFRAGKTWWEAFDRAGVTHIGGAVAYGNNTTRQFNQMLAQKEKQRYFTGRVRVLIEEQGDGF